MAQRYSDPLSKDRMLRGACPECGAMPDAHSDDIRFWLRSSWACDLTQTGVIDRIAQFNTDEKE